MFGTIRKHQTWLWAVIITVIVISFVIYFSPYSRLDDSRRGPMNLGSINGERITEEDYFKARKEVYLRTFFMTGNWPERDAEQQGGELDRETYQWLLLIQKQDQLGIRVGTDVAAQTARTMLSQLQRAGVTSPDVFDKQVLRPRGLGLDDLERFVRHYLGIQELIAVAGLGGRLVAPQDVRDLFKREHEEVSADAVFFSASNYLAGITASQDAVMTFYTKGQAMYRLPERIQVSYVRFDLTNFEAEANQELARMTNLDLQITNAYNQGGTNFLREVRAVSLEDAKVKIRDARRKEFEMQFARKKALEFATPLFDMEPMRPENLDRLAKEKGLVVRTTAPFSLQEGPDDLEVGPDFAQKAFGTTNDPLAGPILGLDGVYVIAFNKKLPSENPPLDQIRARVERDYQFSQAFSAARKAGTNFYQTFTNGLAQGKTPAAICAEAKVKLVEVPPFSLSTRDLPEVEAHLPLNQFKQFAFSTSPGKASPFQMTAEGGLMVYVKKRTTPDPEKLNAGLPAFTRAVHQSRLNEAFNDWFRREAEKGLRDTPLARPQTPPAISPSTPAKKR